MGLRTFFFENTPGILFFLHFTPGNSRENKALPLETSKNYVTCLCNFKRQKQRPLEIPHGFFLITPGNTSMLLINSWKCHLLFLQKPWKFICSTLSFSFFFWKSPIHLHEKSYFFTVSKVKPTTTSIVARFASYKLAS